VRTTRLKVRGFRIELGEVEAAIAAHPGVKAVAARSYGRTSRRRRLIAYVVTDRPEITPAELRRAAQARLPEAMTPSLFILLDALPTHSQRQGRSPRPPLPRSPS